MAQYEHWINTDLDKLPSIVNLGGYTFTGDALSVKIGAVVTQGGEAVTLTGDVAGYVIRPDGVTVVIEGDTSSNRAWVELPESAFSVPGMCSLAIRLTYGTNDSNKVVLCAATFSVKTTSTTTIIDPGSVVPTYQELVEAIDALTDDVAALQDKTTMTEITDSVTVSAESGITVSSYSVYKCGDMIHLFVSFRKSSAINAGASTTIVCTFSGLPLPNATIREVAYNGNSLCVVTLGTSGGVSVRVWDTNLAANTNLNCDFVYLHA